VRIATRRWIHVRRRVSGRARGDRFVGEQEQIDTERLLRMASFGALIHGPSGHYFYGFLDSKIPGTAALTVATKVFIDQVRYVAAGGGRPKKPMTEHAHLPR
jgi:hypothetical protein